MTLSDALIHLPNNVRGEIAGFENPVEALLNLHGDARLPVDPQASLHNGCPCLSAVNVAGRPDSFS